MSFYSDASLVMIPSGYKASKVYSAKPTDGTGDLTFTRSNDTATRVGPDGLIEKVRTNLVTYSNDFSNAAWAKTNFSLTGGQSDPFGGSNAWKAECTSTSGGISQNVAGSGIRVASVYAKAGNVSTFSLWRGNVVAAGVSFNLANGTIISGVGTITSVGGGWYRCSTFADTAEVNPYFNTPTSGDFIYIAFSQLENGDVATDYIATTSTAVSVGPVANVPRLDYLNSSCPRLLLEPQRTNSLTFSEQLNNAAWTNVENVSVSANVSATLDPSGYYGADKLVENTANDQHRIYRSADGTNKTFSFFAKAAGRSWVSVLSNNGTFTYFNIGNGTLGTVAATSTATITPYANGWYRCTVYNTHGSFGSLIQLTTGNNVTSYLGDGTSGAYIWGCQLEAATYATSYVPTLGAAVTRGKDNCIKTSASDLIGQTEGTVFVEFKMNGQSQNEDIYSNNKNLTGSISLQVQTNGQIDAYICYNGNLITLSTSTGAVQIGQTYKIALAYKSGSSALYVNGTQIATSATAFAFTTTLNEIDIANDVVYFGYLNNKEVNQVLQFKTRLSNSSLAELTSL